MIRKLFNWLDGDGWDARMLRITITLLIIFHILNALWLLKEIMR